MEGWTQRMEELDRENQSKATNKPKQLQNKQKGPTKMKSTKKNNDRAKKSFVMSKDPYRGQRLIQIKIFDFTECDNENINSELDSDSEFISVSAQYVVKNPVDEILDSTENLINKICKRMCNREF